MNQSLIENVFEWGKAKGLHTEDLRPQTIKLMEEMGELAAGVARDDEELIMDAVGDALVVMIQFGGSFAKTHPVEPEYFLEACLNKAWQEIKDRKGSTVDGIFVKEEQTEDNIML